MESDFRCSAGHQTHWQDASKGGKSCKCPPARKTRSTEVMKMKGGEGKTTNKKRERPSENLNARCQDVEPKQYSSRTW